MRPAARELRRELRRWLFWVAVLAAVTAALLGSRGRLSEAHVVLVYLLLVLGGSVNGGRPLGLTLALGAFVCIDYFFQPPFDSIGAKPIDFTVLLTFLATAAVATHLLARARTEAARARRRAEEVGWLAQLGAEILDGRGPQDAVEAVARCLHERFGLRRCTVWGWDGSALAPLTGTGDAPPDPVALPGVAADVATRGATIAHYDDGTLAPAPFLADADRAPIGSGRIRDLLIPLRVGPRTVGVLHLAPGAPLPGHPPARRMLGALVHYAALGVERVRLAEEARHADALREADRMKDIVLASVSHDLRTPITTIRALAEVSAGRGDAQAGVIVEQAERLSRLVGDLLDLSRLRGGGFPVAPEPNTAEDLLGALARQTMGVAGGRLEVDVDVTAPALLGRFDFVQTLRILGNLVENAVRFAPAPSAVVVGAAREGDRLVFTVADRGPGVPPAERERIFEAFYRPRQVLPDVRGAGLGLAIARWLAVAQGGTLEYREREGGGSLFRLALPALDLDPAGDAAGGANGAMV